MENQPKINHPPKESKISVFTGFWKLFGVTGTFLMGIVLFWWGARIMLSDWVTIRNAMGPVGNLVLAPLFVGLALVIMAFIEFKRIAKEGNQ